MSIISLDRFFRTSSTWMPLILEWSKVICRIVHESSPCITSKLRSSSRLLSRNACWISHATFSSSSWRDPGVVSKLCDIVAAAVEPKKLRWKRLSRALAHFKCHYHCQDVPSITASMFKTWRKNPSVFPGFSKTIVNPFPRKNTRTKGRLAGKFFETHALFLGCDFKAKTKVSFFRFRNPKR